MVFYEVEPKNARGIKIIQDIEEAGIAERTLLIWRNIVYYMLKRIISGNMISKVSQPNFKATCRPKKSKS